MVTFNVLFVQCSQEAVLGFRWFAPFGVDTFPLLLVSDKHLPSADALGRC